MLRLRVIRPIHGPHPLRGRCKQRSNPLHADLSFPPVTYLCKLLGIHSLVAFLQLELFRA
ncbi:hypothetical protein D7I65_03170 [Escherichia albertii]|nr:hypothetical protein [Escherichia albertii]EEW7549668.1 hypothetical protein [Escherichia albertii]